MAARTVLILGADELGEAIIDALAASQQIQKDYEIKVLLCPAPIISTDPSKVALRKSLATCNVEIVGGDIVHDSQEVLTSIFKSLILDSVAVRS